jgi:cytochrome P450
MGKPIVVMAGQEANKFAQKHGGQVFSHQDLFYDLAKELGSPRNMIALEGDIHTLYRKTAKSGYSRKTVIQGMQEIFVEVDKFIDMTPVGTRFELFPAVQRLISIQLGKIAMNVDVTPQIDALQDFMRRLLYIEVSKIWPKWFKKFPRYRRSQQITLALADEIVAQHLEYPPGKARPRDLVDDFLEAHRENPQQISMADVRSAALGPILAGQDTVAGTTAYMMYAILHNEQIYAQVQAEVNQLFKSEVISSAQLREASTLHEVAKETMRRYPVAPFVPQIAVEEFTFAGYRIPQGQMVYLAQSVIHFLDENFEDPFTFRIDREQTIKPSDISPFGLGPHICIGAGMGEIQIMLNIARLLYQGEYSISPANYQIVSKALPPSPKNFYVELVRKRN